jgi:hypothetical protein
MRTIGHWVDGHVIAPDGSPKVPVRKEGVMFSTRAKIVTSRRPHAAHPASASFSFPTSS